MESMEKVKQGISGYGELYRIRGKGFLRPWEGLALPPKNSTEMGAGAAWYLVQSALCCASVKVERGLFKQV